MDSPAHTADTGHALQGPHLERIAWNADEFVSLRLREFHSHHGFQLTKPAVLVGRHTDADLRLAFPEVSRRHCRIFFEHGDWHIEDLHSLNGLFVNGSRVRRTQLFFGDHIRLGSVTFVVEGGAAAPRGPEHPKILKSIAEALPAQVDQPRRAV